MTTYDLGATVTHIWAGAPTGGTFAVAITRPDGTSFTPPTLGTSGVEPSVTFVPDMAGRWFLRWASTTPNAAYSEIVDIWPTDPMFLISTDDAAAGLNWPASSSADSLNDLRLYIAAATPVIEDIVGPVTVRQYVQLVQRGWQYASLDVRPVVAIVSMVYSDSTPLDPANYIFDPVAGLITYYTPTQDIATITYTAGKSNIIPQNIRLATRELVRHWWQIGKQGLRSMNGTMPITADAWTPSGFAVPRRVIELCAAHQEPGGFA